LNFWGKIFDAGQGPADFLRPSTTGVYEKTPEGITMWVSDNSLRRLRNINFTQSLQQKKTIIETDYSYNQSYYNLSPVKENEFLSTFYDGLNLNLITYKPLEKKTENHFKFFKNNLEEVFYISGNFSLKPDKTKMAYSLIFFNQIVISSIDGREKFAVSVGAPISKEKIAHTGRADRTEYFSMIATSDNLIWLLYHAKTALELRKDNVSSKLLVFDWDGNSKYLFDTGVHLVSIFLDSQHQFLYGIDKEEHLWKYDIRQYTNNGE